MGLWNVSRQWGMLLQKVTEKGLGVASLLDVIL